MTNNPPHPMRDDVSASTAETPTTESCEWSRLGFSADEAGAWARSRTLPWAFSPALGFGCFSASEALAWKETGFEPQEASEWAAGGVMDPETADYHEGFTPVEAHGWRLAGFDPLEAQAWDWVAGVNCAKDAKRHGYTPDNLWEFMDALRVHGGADPLGWLHSGLPADYVVRCIEAGITAEEARSARGTR